MFNLALLARQAWRLLDDPGSPSSLILKVVYYPNNSISDATLGAHSSQIWRAILHGKDIMTHGSIRRLGDRESPDIWNDN